VGGQLIVVGFTVFLRNSRMVLFNQCKTAFPKNFPKIDSDRMISPRATICPAEWRALWTRIYEGTCTD
jgi:hypothetical protein